MLALRQDDAADFAVNLRRVKLGKVVLLVAELDARIPAPTPSGGTTPLSIGAGMYMFFMIPGIPGRFFQVTQGGCFYFNGAACVSQGGTNFFPERKQLKVGDGSLKKVATDYKDEGEEEKRVHDVREGLGET